jgi:hypothetical protein
MVNPGNIGSGRPGYISRNPDFIVETEDPNIPKTPMPHSSTSFQMGR